MVRSGAEILLQPFLWPAKDLKHDCPCTRHRVGCWGWDGRRRRCCSQRVCGDLGKTQEPPTDAYGLHAVRAVLQKWGCMEDSEPPPHWLTPQLVEPLTVYKALPHAGAHLTLLGNRQESWCPSDRWGKEGLQSSLAHLRSLAESEAESGMNLGFQTLSSVFFLPYWCPAFLKKVVEHVQLGAIMLWGFKHGRA